MLTKEASFLDPSLRSGREDMRWFRLRSTTFLNNFFSVLRLRAASEKNKKSKTILVRELLKMMINLLSIDQLTFLKFPGQILQ